MTQANLCIYCAATDERCFAGREHVIPQAFGKFGSKTPTLDCVCDGCNAAFAKELDQILARDTLEGIMRYKHGILSSEKRSQQRLRFTLAEPSEAGQFLGAVLDGIDPTTNELLPVATQLQIFNRQTGKTDIFKKSQLGKFTLPEEIYGKPGERKISVFAPSREEHDTFIAALNRDGFDVRVGEPFSSDIAPENITGDAEITLGVHIECEFDDLHRRALGKILVNFAAYYLGAAEVTRPKWNALKQFVRYGESKLPARLSNKPFWDGQETDKLRWPDAINIRLENHAKGILGTIQFYNGPLYELLLVEDYRLTQEVAARFTAGEEPQFGYRGIKIGKEFAKPQRITSIA